MRIGRVLLLAMLSIPMVDQASACPFCAKLTRSYADDIRGADAVLFATLSVPEDLSAETTRVEVRHVIRSPETDQMIETIAASVPAAKGRPIDRIVFLARAGNEWTPRRIDVGSPALAEYLAEVWSRIDEPASGRLAFFFDRLDDPDPRISQDAYAEFAKASFRATEAAARSYDVERIKRWLDDPRTPADRVGLFGLLLGLKGNKSDADHLARIADDPSPTQLVGLDGILGGLSYLDPEAGSSRVVRILTSPDSSLARRLAALAALRFLMTDLESRVPPGTLEATISALSYPEVAAPLADELRRGGCWSAWPSVVRLADSPRDEPAVIRFALASPEADAQEWLAQIRKTKSPLVLDAEQALAFERDAEMLGK